MIAVIGLAAVLTLGVAACGGDGTAEGGGETAATTTQAGQGFEAELQALLAGESYGTPPASGPKPQAGKKIWVFSCLEAAETCSVPAHAQVEAAEALGWEATLFDTKSEPARIAEGVRQAIADGADGVVWFGLDCEQVGPQPLRELREAGVRVSVAESMDCESPLFDAVVSYTQGSYPDWFRAFGTAQATALIAATDGRAKVIVFDGPMEALSLQFPLDGFKEKLATCPGCEIVASVEFVVADLGPALEQKAQQALVEHPDANTVYVTSDSTLAAGVTPALKASGRASEVLVVAAEGQESTMTGIRAGAFRAVGVGNSPVWEGYQTVDNLVRLFAGEEPAPSGIGLQVYDAAHNVPAKGGFQPPVDFKAAYRKAWGLDG
jgi:ribose transport system substrate-binding protein